MSQSTFLGVRDETSGMSMKIYTVNLGSILNEMFSKEILRKQQIIAPRNNYLQGLVA